MFTIRWNIIWDFFAMSGIGFWFLLCLGSTIFISLCLTRIINDKSYQEFIKEKAERRNRKMQKRIKIK